MEDNPPILLSFLVLVQLAREEWSDTLWANLNIAKLTDGIEGFMRKLRKLPKEAKALPVCHVLEDKMRSFKDSIPLFADLKNEALRERQAGIVLHPVALLEVQLFPLHLSCSGTGRS